MSLKKLWIAGLVLLPGLTLTTANLTASAENKSVPAKQVLLAANEEMTAQPAAEETATQETTASIESENEPEKKDNKALFISGALVMGILLVIVLYKTKAIVKDED